jgi:hypothetical protein
MAERKRKAPAKRTAKKHGGKRASVTPPSTAPARSAKARQAATAAKHRAKANGAVGPNGTDAQRRMRDSAVMAALLAGDDEKDVASEFGIASRTVRTIRARFDGAGPTTVLNSEPMEIITSRIADYERRLRDFDRMAYAHADNNPSVAVSAMKGAVQVTEQITELLRKVGKLPEDLELFRNEALLRRMVEEMVDAVEELERGKITAAEVGFRFRKMMGAEQPIAIEATAA